MNRYFWAWVIPVLILVSVFAFSLLWLSSDSDRAVSLRLPGCDGRPAKDEPTDEPVKLTGTLENFREIAMITDPAPRPFKKVTGSWPWFRGSNFNSINNDDIKPARKWPEGGPKVLWSVDLGQGYAGAAINNGCVYVVDYDQEKKADAIRCFSLEDGSEIWRYSYPVKIKRNHGMSRTVPAVTDKYIVSLGPKCHLTCLDAVTGEFKWMYNLVREFGTEVPLWYAGQCPFIEDGKVIIAPAGNDVLMMAVDCETGQIVWKTPNPNKWDMTHTSILPMEFAGKKMYVYPASGGVTGVSADDGSILWETNQWKLRTNVPSPVLVDDGLIFLCAGYGKGSMMLKLNNDAGTITPEPVFTLKPKVFGSEQHTPVFYDGYIYGMRTDWQMVCMDLDGNIVWTSTSQHDFKKLGPYMIADGLMYIMDGSGKLTMAEVTPAGYVQLDQAQVLDGIESWAPMAMVSGKLIVRDLKRMVCLDVGE